MRAVTGTLRRSWRSTALVLMMPGLLAASQDIAVPHKPDDNVPKLELKPDSAVAKGQVAAVQGTLGPEPVRYAVGGLSILQPVVVMLLARDAADDLTLSLFKSDWTTARRTGSTRGSGMASFEFRTQGGVNILLRGPSTPVPFALVVWAGDELHPPMSDLLVMYDEFRKGKSGATPAAATKPGEPGMPATTASRVSVAGGLRDLPMAVWIAAAVLGGGGAALFFRRKGRRGHDH